MDQLNGVTSNSGAGRGVSPWQVYNTSIIVKGKQHMVGPRWVYG